MRKFFKKAADMLTVPFIIADMFKRSGNVGEQMAKVAQEKQSDPVMPSDKQHIPEDKDLSL